MKPILSLVILSFIAAIAACGGPTAERAKDDINNAGSELSSGIGTKADGGTLGDGVGTKADAGK